MEEEWVVDRCKLREVWLEHPEWSRRDLAEAVGRSRSWVKKWLHQIRGSTLADREVLNGRSRARKRPPREVAPEVVNRILDLRDHPPQKLGRTPGPLTILYYLKQDKNLTETGLILPRSTRTIWKILDPYHRILRPTLQEHEAEERPEPGVEWGLRKVHRQFAQRMPGSYSLPGWQACTAGRQGIHSLLQSGTTSSRHRSAYSRSLRSARVKANQWTHQNQGDPWRITSQLFLCNLFELTRIVLHQSLTNKGEWYLLTTEKSDQVVFGGL